MQETVVRAPPIGDDRRWLGRHVYGFTIEMALGSGPIGASWLAKRGEEVGVVRVLAEPYASDPVARAQWLRASWAANRFHHPRVVKLVGQNTDPGGPPAVVRGWAKGEALHEVVCRGAMDRAAALRLMEQLLDVLEIAHAHGIVHGALSPSNLIVTPRGSLRLVDFAAPPGLLGRASGDADALGPARAGDFAAPERHFCPTIPASEQADVWSVGACLHFALTGAAPPADPDRAAHPSHGVVERAGHDVAAMIGLATSRDAGARYESAYAMLGDVRRILAGRRPKLGAAIAPVPSQSLAQGASLRPSWSGSRAEAEIRESKSGAASEWRGNLLLMFAIALVVCVATFVMVRERLGDGPLGSTPSTTN
jgi:serine/threonine protein kinase